MTEQMQTTFTPIDIYVRTNESADELKKFKDLEKKYTAHKILRTSWWEHPCFNRGHSSWLSYIEGEYYDVYYSSHEFETAEHKIEYILKLRVECVTGKSWVQDAIKTYKETRRDYHKEQQYRQKERAITDVKTEYDARIKQLEAERDIKIKAINDLHYSLKNDNSWQLAEDDIQTELYGKLPPKPKTAKKSKK